MMYGYGDAPAPYKETVDLVEVRGAPLHPAQPAAG